MESQGQSIVAATVLDGVTQSATQAATEAAAAEIFGDESTSGE